MPGYRWQPDFVIQIGGRDLTRYCLAWELTDTEEGLSSIRADFWNFGTEKLTEKEITIRWGYQGNLSEPVTMRIKEHTELYDIKGLRFSVVAYDALERLTGVSATGLFRDDNVREAIKTIGQLVEPKLNVTVDGENPVFQKEHRLSITNERLVDAQKRLMSLLGVPKKTSPARMSHTLKAIKQQAKGVKQANFDGLVREGIAIAMGPYLSKDKTGKLNNIMENILNQVLSKASGDSVRGQLEMYGDPKFRAKTVIEVRNVGNGSGKWYVKTATHRWNPHLGYRDYADLILPDETPMVQYAEIYKRDEIYVGPRKLDQQGGVYTYGVDDKLVIAFKFTETVQSSRAAGEAATTQHIPISKAEQEEIMKLPEGWAPF